MRADLEKNRKKHKSKEGKVEKSRGKTKPKKAPKAGVIESDDELKTTPMTYDEKRQLRVAYNSVFRKIFGYRAFESVTNLQHSLVPRRPTWEELVDKRQGVFLQKAQLCEEGSLIKLLRQLRYL